MFPVADRFLIYVTSDPAEHLRPMGVDGKAENIFTNVH